MSQGARLDRYHNVGANERGEPYLWPGGPLGFPVVGQSKRLLKQDEFSRLTPSCTYHTQEFFGDDKESRRAYEEVMERSANGWYVLRHLERHWLEDRKCYCYCVEWAVPFYELPAAKGSNGQARPGGPFNRLAGTQSPDVTW